MWVLNNQTPFEAERTWVRDKCGAEVWLVAVKGTFDINPDGSLVLADKQEEVVIAPEFRGDPQSSSLLYDTDLPHKKHATDVLVFGHAYAPQKKPIKSIKVALKVASINKVLQVTGDRVWADTPGGVSMSFTKPFLKMPIDYERAYGGMDLTSNDPIQHDWDVRNPAGCGFAIKDKNLVGKSVPNIEYPNELIKNLLRRPLIAGFGPIAGHWSSRVRFAGTYDEKWEKTRQPLLPEDFDERYYQCAPQDQQVQGYLKGGELVQLINMTPSGHLQFRLPHFNFSFVTYYDDGSSDHHRADLHTVIIRPDVLRVVMVWHTHLECHHKVIKLSNTTISLKERILLSERDVEIVME